MYCKKCGRKISDDSVFCLKCGEKVVDYKTTDVDNIQEKVLPRVNISKQNIGIILSILIIVAATLLIVEIFKSRRNLELSVDDYDNRIEYIAKEWKDTESNYLINITNASDTINNNNHTQMGWKEIYINDYYGFINNYGISLDTSKDCRIFIPSKYEYNKLFEEQYNTQGIYMIFSYGDSEMPFLELGEKDGIEAFTNDYLVITDISSDTMQFSYNGRSYTFHVNV